MLRFRNPGSTIATQIQLFHTIYEYLSDKSSFDYHDMETAVAKTTLMTSNGYSGASALAITGTKANSLNATKMNMKMYAEIFRILGWVSPAQQTTSYPIRFTVLGDCAAQNQDGAMALVKESLLGYVTPSAHIKGVSYKQNIRFFPTVLRSLLDLDGRMHKHELCIGPMCLDDTDETQYDAMIADIRSIRGSYARLKARFEGLANAEDMKPTSVDNLTRFPIGVLRDVGWIKTGLKDRKLYDRPLSLLEITKSGEQAYKTASKMHDIRLKDFENLENNQKESITRLGLFTMLQRAGYNVKSAEKQIQQDIISTNTILAGKELLYSPYQTLTARQVDQALGIQQNSNKSTPNDAPNESYAKSVKPPSPIARLALVTSINYSELRTVATPTRKTNKPQISKDVERLFQLGKSHSEIADELFLQHRRDKQSEFYPLIADIFGTLGMNCKVSRAGDNGARWDAIIVDEANSIPIEIKSPTEEINLSLKAIRQALENKVVLLSRVTHGTTYDTTSLAVGYEQPSARAEVKQLISDIYTAFDINIGVITLRTLLSLAIKAILDGTVPNHQTIQYLKGILDVDF